VEDSWLVARFKRSRLASVLQAAGNWPLRLLV
jgi:hypothetical protein